MNLRERNKLRNKRELAEISLRLFLKDGFDQTTVEAIAREAQISARTFFRYFPTKEEAFFANQEDRLDRFRDLLGEQTQSDPPFERVRRGCLQMADAFMEDRERVLAQYKVINDSKHLLAYDLQLDIKWETAIHVALVAGRDDLDHQARARLQAGAVLGVIRAELRHWFRSGCDFDIVARGEEAFEELALLF